MGDWCTQRMRAGRGWTCTMPKETPGLEPRTRALVHVAVAVASGDTVALRDRLGAARAGEVPGRRAGGGVGGGAGVWVGPARGGGGAGGAADARSVAQLGRAGCAGVPGGVWAH